MYLDVYKDKMTLFYSKKSGEIQTFCTGVQDMNFFGENKDDYTVIWDFLVIGYNDKVLNNLSMFVIDLNSKSIKLKDFAF